MANDYKMLLRLFLDLCLIKKGPQDVPDNTMLMKIVFFTYFMSGTVLLSGNIPIIDAVIQALIDTVLIGLFMYVLVSFFSVPNRFNQSLIAIYGSGALITVFSTPFIFWVQTLSNNEQPTGAAGLVVFLIVCWSFVVMANIIRETIRKNLSTCLLLTFCYLYLSYQLINMLYPIETA
ncbi:MAG TPA: hypothetical protein EYG50_08425 [Cycloclasticus sp.]|nr:hypothetical protein [Cycloclasticus sp.]HIL92747.1 hypothetical protein [Cycloclasticus sp.]